MLIQAIILLLGIPAGFLIAYLANDELVAGRRWFLGLILVGALAGAGFVYVENWAIALSLGFVIIVSCISYWKSFDKKWTRKRI